MIALLLFCDVKTLYAFIYSPYRPGGLNLKNALHNILSFFIDLRKYIDKKT